MAEDQPKATEVVMDSDDDKMDEKEIDQNLEESFPASDPPSWTLGTDHRDEPPPEPSPQEHEEEISDE